MERKQYLLMCRECAMLEKNEKGVPCSTPDRLRIVWQGLEFFPIDLTISFDREGNVRNHCKFHDLRADSVAGAELWEIKPKIEWEA